MWQRAVLAILAILLTFSGIHMLVSPEHWYHSLESVPYTGPFNPHFVRDIGCAYLAAASGLALGAWRARWIVPGSLTALTFLGIHAGLHIWESLAHHPVADHMGVVDFVGIYGPPLVAAAILVLSHRQSESQEA